jgi:hypothetical protein
LWIQAHEYNQLNDFGLSSRMRDIWDTTAADALMTYWAKRDAPKVDRVTPVGI